MEQDLLSMIFPEGLLEYFNVKRCKKGENEYTIYLEEKNLAPKGYSKDEIKSKGFFEEEKVTDFPLRGKPCTYRLKRRKWFVKSSGKIIVRDWNLVAKGTRMTQEFADFLKELDRYNTH